jgi:tRNA(fMet)-specific endonuclease VapC
MAPHAATEFAFSIISFHEQVLGANAFTNRAKTMAELIRGYGLFQEVFEGFQAFPVLPFDQAAGVVLDGLRASKIRLGTMDLLIASIALSQSLVLLTRNSVDFSKVPGLVIENWTV